MSEAALEDYIFQHPHELLLDSHVIGRQLVCDYGVMDLLLWGPVDSHGNRWERPFAHIVELKVSPALDKHCAQVLRYKHSVMAAMNSWWANSKWGFAGGESGEAIPEEPECILVAPRFTPMAEAVADAADISLVRIDHRGAEGVGFEAYKPRYYGRRARDTKRPWSLALAMLHEEMWGAPSGS